MKYKEQFFMKQKGENGHKFILPLYHETKIFRKPLKSYGALKYHKIIL